MAAGSPYKIPILCNNKDVEAGDALVRYDLLPTLHSGSESGHLGPPWFLPSVLFHVGTRCVPDNGQKAPSLSDVRGEEHAIRNNTILRRDKPWVTNSDHCLICNKRDPRTANRTDMVRVFGNSVSPSVLGVRPLSRWLHRPVGASYKWWQLH